MKVIDTNGKHPSVRRIYTSDVDLDFFTREGERFIREDPLLPFTNSILTDITQNQDQSWCNEQEIESAGCSTTTFFMAKSSTPDEMLNALLSGNMLAEEKSTFDAAILLGKPDGMAMKENQSINSSRALLHGWNEFSSMTKKSTSGLNLRQQKNSPFNEVNTIDMLLFSTASNPID